MLKILPNLMKLNVIYDLQCSHKLLNVTFSQLLRIFMLKRYLLVLLIIGSAFMLNACGISKPVGTATKEFLSRQTHITQVLHAIGYPTSIQDSYDGNKIYTWSYSETSTFTTPNYGFTNYSGFSSNGNYIFGQSYGQTGVDVYSYTNNCIVNILVQNQTGLILNYQVGGNSCK